MFSLESPHRGNSNEYTQYAIFNMKKKEKHPKLSQICSYGKFSKELKNEFERAVVNEPSVFEPLKFYCVFKLLVVACSNGIFILYSITCTLLPHIFLSECMFQPFFGINYTRNMIIFLSFLRLREPCTPYRSGKTDIDNICTLWNSADVSYATRLWTTPDTFIQESE